MNILYALALFSDKLQNANSYSNQHDAAVGLLLFGFPRFHEKREFYIRGIRFLQIKIQLYMFMPKEHVNEEKKL